QSPAVLPGGMETPTILPGIPAGDSNFRLLVAASQISWQAPSPIFSAAPLSGSSRYNPPAYEPTRSLPSSVITRPAGLGTLVYFFRAVRSFTLRRQISLPPREQR